MLWLDRPPVLRWVAAAALVAVAAWSELAPPPTSEQNFLVEEVAAGTRVESHHVERRSVPVGVVETVEPSGVAASDLQAGEPLVASMLTDIEIPQGWVVLSASVPSHAPPGGSATAIIVGRDTAPMEFPALVVAAGTTDPFGEDGGTVAVPAEWVGAAASASAENRLVIGVDSPGR